MVLRLAADTPLSAADYNASYTEASAQRLYAGRWRVQKGLIEGLIKDPVKLYKKQAGR
jgi:hypothetical protein